MWGYLMGRTLSECGNLMGRTLSECGNLMGRTLSECGCNSRPGDCGTHGPAPRFSAKPPWYNGNTGSQPSWSQGLTVLPSRSARWDQVKANCGYFGDTANLSTQDRARKIQDLDPWTRQLVLALDVKF
jgi:hypothetical protein